jgi:hypothetical protein
VGLGKALASIGHGPIAMANAHSFGKAAALAGARILSPFGA